MNVVVVICAALLSWWWARRRPARYVGVDGALRVRPAHPGVGDRARLPAYRLAAPKSLRITVHGDAPPEAIRFPGSDRDIELEPGWWRLIDEESYMLMAHTAFGGRVREDKKLLDVSLPERRN